MSDKGQFDLEIGYRMIWYYKDLLQVQKGEFYRKGERYFFVSWWLVCELMGEKNKIEEQ